MICVCICIFCLVFFVYHGVLCWLSLANISYDELLDQVKKLGFTVALRLRQKTSLY